MSFEKRCNHCPNLEACKELEAEHYISTLPMWVPLGWFLLCPDGWREGIVVKEIRPLLEHDGSASGEHRYMPRSKREQQIAALLEDDGPLPSYVVARRIGLHFNTTRAIMCKMFKRGELDREQRGRVHWYALAA